MFDLFDEVVVAPPLKIRPPQRKSEKAPLVVDGGMFALTDTLNESRYAAVYHSGATAYYDMLGFIKAGKDIGVAADKLAPLLEHTLRQYLRDGGKVFVDSGAYTRNAQWEAGKAPSPELDFAAVFALYRRLTADMTPAALARLAIVMPDVLKQSARSLELVELHRESIVALVHTGVNVIVPIQRGATPAAETAEKVFAILGTRQVTLGIPSSAAAMPIQDVATIRNHGRFHILGRASMNIDLYQRSYAVLEHNPGAYISCDANLIRSNTSLIGQAHRNLIAEQCDAVWESKFDDTELLYDVLNGNDWMSKPQVARLAAFYGVKDAAVVRSWIKLHKEGCEGLRPVIERFDPEATLLNEYGIAAVFRQEAEDNLSARLRADAVAVVFGKSQPAVGVYA